VVVSTVYHEAEAARRAGLEAYSYPFVAKAFLPLLAEWGETAVVTQPESRLDHSLHRQRKQGREPVHLSFLPLHWAYLTGRAPTACFPFWEYPDVPGHAAGPALRSNWAHIADKADLLLTACTFTRDAFRRAGVRAPIHVIPVPVADAYFAVPPWQLGQSVRLDCRCFVFQRDADAPPPADDTWLPQDRRPFRVRAWLEAIVRGFLRPRLPRRLDALATVAVRAARKFRKAYRAEVAINHPETPHLDLSGVVYTTVLNPFDGRKNLHDVLTAFLLALSDKEDATLVVKLVLSPRLKVPEFNQLIVDLGEMGLRHRCKLVVVPDYLSDAQMVELVRASTYYVTAARAEGACLPLQAFLAAGRPGVAPTHTALADYFGPEVGFPIASHPEPTFWPTDPQERLTTSWQRIVWQSLADQFRASYAAAKDAVRYGTLALAARARLRKYAGVEAVRPRLFAALDALAAGKQETRRAA
jgi:glycosyltransferase involved in cell wall biosynthesis